MNKLTPYLPDLKRTLNAFLDFLLSFPCISEEEKQAAEQICNFNFHEPISQRDWSASLDIFDHELQMKAASRTGPYTRTWTISYECNRIEVAAVSKIDYNETDRSSFEFFFCYLFDLDEVFTKNQTAVDFALFLDDVKNYQYYLTENLNSIDVDISA